MRSSACASRSTWTTTSCPSAPASSAIRCSGRSSGARSRALIEASRGVARGHIDLTRCADSRRRLLRIRGIGPWTVEKLGLHGQGDDDQLPAGDLAYIKLVGRLADLGRRAEVEEVREFFAPYEPFRALAGIYLLVGGGTLTAARPPLGALA